MDSHLIINQLNNGLLRVVAEEGYYLWNTRTQRRHSEAIVASANGFVAVLDGNPPQPHERTLEDAKREKLHALALYDASPAVNAFSIGGQSTWRSPEERANYILTLQGAQRSGVESVSFLGQQIPVAAALQMLDAINIYAMQCVGVTEAHADAINAKRKIETVDAYDFTVGYPEKLSF